MSKTEKERMEARFERTHQRIHARLGRWRVSRDQQRKEVNDARKKREQ